VALAQHIVAGQRRAAPSAMKGSAEGGCVIVCPPVMLVNLRHRPLAFAAPAGQRRRSALRRCFRAAFTPARLSGFFVALGFGPHAGSAGRFTVAAAFTVIAARIRSNGETIISAPPLLALPVPQSS
jgi:hypothetical protein